MLRDDEYELMPHTELEYLRKEVERLKRNPLGDTQASISLLDSMNRLNTGITRLNDILAGASDDMVKAYSDTTMQEQMRKMTEQNEKLARGIVAVAEMVKELQKKQDIPEMDQFIQSRRASQQPQQYTPQAFVQQPAQQQYQPLIVQEQPQIVIETPVLQSRNPFTEDHHDEFAPLPNQPLPRPTSVPPGMMTAMESMRPPEQPNAPGFMMHAGLRERIPDADIPLPPRRM